MLRFIDNALNNHKSKQFIPIHVFLAVVTLISIASLVLENITSFNIYSQTFLLIEWITVAIFSLEYLGRIMVAPKKLEYIFSVWGIFDLVSILPTYLGLGNWTFLKSVRILRILILLRTTHLSKLPETYLESAGQNLHQKTHQKNQSR